MAYSYCRKCEASLDEPTTREVFNDEHTCWNCGYGHPINEDKGDRIEQLEARIKALEDRLNKQVTHVS